MSDLEKCRSDTEFALDYGITLGCGCLDLDLSRDEIISIRREVITELVRLSKEKSSED